MLGSSCIQLIGSSSCVTGLINFTTDTIFYSKFFSAFPARLMVFINTMDQT